MTHLQGQETGIQWVGRLGYNFQMSRCFGDHLYLLLYVLLSSFGFCLVLFFICCFPV